MSRLKRVRPPVAKPERLTAAAIRREGVVHSGGKLSHWEIRYDLRDEFPNKKMPGDEEGFLTSTGRFVSRSEAVPVGVKSGQLSARWGGVNRELLSSDISWNARP